METGPLLCPRCKKPIEPFTIEEIAGITQLRAGKALIQRIEASCLTPGCGCTFSWNIRQHHIEKMTQEYERMTLEFKRLIDLYNPE